jgi:hypothetical protein
MGAARSEGIFASAEMAEAEGPITLSSTAQK